MKKRTKGHNETSISGDTRADWSEAFAFAPSLEVAYVWHASKFTREVLDGLLRIGFLHHQQIIWNKGQARTADDGITNCQYMRLIGHGIEVAPIPCHTVLGHKDSLAGPKPPFGDGSCSS
jgi:hypothetical protein